MLTSPLAGKPGTGQQLGGTRLAPPAGWHGGAPQQEHAAWVQYGMNQLYGRQGHPYDLGWHANLQAVCGEWEGLWPLPVRLAAAGDGLSFPVAAGDVE